MKFDYLIVGSGLSGAVVANEAKKHNKTCLVIEKRNHIGGNVYCECIEGITVHKYGAHIFHTDNKRVWNYINEFSDFNNYINSPIANYKGELFNLPFNMNTFIRMWNITTPQEAMDKINKQQKAISTTPKNLEEQAIALVGMDIYNKLIKGYTQKQWGRVCSQLPPELIKRLPVRFTFDNNYFNDRYQGIPQKGYNVIIKKMLDNVQVETGVDFINNRDTYSEMADKIIYTGMIDKYYGYKYGALEYRSLRFESQILNKDNYQGVAVMNYTDAETPYTRIIEHKHFVFGKQDKTVITKEYPLEWQPCLEPYYPLNDNKNQELYLKYQQLAQGEENVFFLGRLAQYQYNDMDKTIENALLWADKEFIERDL